MTYSELGDLLDCSPEEAQRECSMRGLDRKRSRDGYIRVKLTPQWADQFVRTAHASAQTQDVAVEKLRRVHVAMNAYDLPRLPAPKQKRWGW